MSGAATGSPQEKPDPLDRIEDAARKQGAWGLERAEVLVLVEIARAARDLTTMDGQNWLPRFNALEAALARLDGNHT